MTGHVFQAAASTAAAFGLCLRFSPNRLIRSAADRSATQPFLGTWQARFAHPVVAHRPRKTAKIVVGMQHPPTTFHGTAITPKKSPDARLFSFPPWMAPSRCPTRYTFWL